MTTEPSVSVQDIAKHFGVARDSVSRWIEERGLPAHKINPFWNFGLSEVSQRVRTGGADSGDEADEGTAPMRRRRR